MPMSITHSDKVSRQEARTVALCHAEIRSASDVALLDALVHLAAPRAVPAPLAAAAAGHPLLIDLTDTPRRVVATSR